MSNELTQTCLDLAWSQWTALGVSGVVPPPDDAIDLEALILFTPTLRDADPRLHDEALDWCVQFGARTVSLARLRRLHRALSDDQRASFADFAGALQQHAGVVWPGARPPAHRYRPSGKSRLPSPLIHPSLIQLRARHLIGTSARVEILIALLMAREGELITTARLASLGYAKQNVAAVLDDLVLADAIERVQQGNQYLHRLSNPRSLAAVLQPLPRSAPPWALRLPVLAGLRAVEEQTGKKATIVQDVAAAKELQKHMAAIRTMGCADSRVPYRGSSSRRIGDWAISTLTGRR